MNQQRCLRCKKLLDISGCLVCEKENQTINQISKCPLDKYQFVNQNDFMRDNYGYKIMSNM